MTEGLQSAVVHCFTGTAGLDRTSLVIIYVIIYGETRRLLWSVLLCLIRHGYWSQPLTVIRPRLG